MNLTVAGLIMNIISALPKVHTFSLKIEYLLDRLSYVWIDGTQLPLWSKFHGEFTDLLYIFQIFPTHCYINQLQWHISLEVWFIYFQMSAAVSWAVQARQCSHHIACKCINKSTKVDFSPSKKVFMSKVLDSRSNDLQRFGRYKVGQ